MNKEFEEREQQKEQQMLDKMISRSNQLYEEILRSQLRTKVIDYLIMTGVIIWIIVGLKSLL